MPKITRLLTSVGAAAAALVLAGRGAGAATITVNGIADTIADDGVCTLREAIIAANTNASSGVMAGECAAGAASPAVDTIVFAIAGAGVQTVSPLSQLPSVCVLTAT
jgi:CSLREA domain-containing protein